MARHTSMGAASKALGIGITTLVVAALLAVVPPAPSTQAATPTAASVGLVDPATGQWHLRDYETGAVTSFYFGNPGDVPFMGDWNCDGIDTPGLFRSSDAFVYLRNSNDQGNADIRFFFGNPGDEPIVGDFNKDGCDTVSIYRPSTQQFFIINKLGANEGGLGAAEADFIFGNPGDKPVTGDWDGDGVTEVGLHRESTGFFYWRDTLDQGNASGEIFFGDPGDRFVAGDWGTVDGRDTPAVFRPSNAIFYFRHTLTQGNADSEFALGESAFLPVAGVFKATVGGTPEGGVLLEGDAASPALAALVDLPPQPAPETDIDGDIILSRLDVGLAPGATVAQVNAALESVGARIVTMYPGFPTVTVAVPRAADAEALTAVADALEQAPGIGLVSIGRMASPEMLPASGAGDVSHLIPTRFPAAWNAKDLALAGCVHVTVFVSDIFGTTEVGNFLDEVDAFGGLEYLSGDSPHGWVVTGVIAAAFNASSPTGAYPFTQCLDIRGIQVSSITGWQSHLETYERVRSVIDEAAPLPPFLVNTSWGYHDDCDVASTAAVEVCTSLQMKNLIAQPVDRATTAADWKAVFKDLWDELLWVAAAGNDRDNPEGDIYRGLRAAQQQGGWAAATLPDLVDAATNVFWWQPAADAPNDYKPPEMPLSLVIFPTDAEIIALNQHIDSRGVRGLVAPNVLIVGSVAGTETANLSLSDFSEEVSDVKAVGEAVPTFSDANGGEVQGTSFAAPQVTALAAYLWLLSDELRWHDDVIALTKQAMIENTVSDAPVSGVIDAYASVLSLDEVSPDEAYQPSPATAPVRLKILDVHPKGQDGTYGDGDFDIDDVKAYMYEYVSLVTGQPFEPATPDYSRYDLNGDGYTGGNEAPVGERHRGRFDLDRVGSTQFGTTSYTRVPQLINDTKVFFDESSLTDMEILCYYAYSPLFTSDGGVALTDLDNEAREAREKLLNLGHCRPGIRLFLGDSGNEFGGDGLALTHYEYLKSPPPGSEPTDWHVEVQSVPESWWPPELGPPFILRGDSVRYDELLEPLEYSPCAFADLEVSSTRGAPSYSATLDSASSDIHFSAPHQNQIHIEVSQSASAAPVYVTYHPPGIGDPDYLHTFAQYASQALTDLDGVYEVYPAMVLDISNPDGPSNLVVEWNAEGEVMRDYEGSGIPTASWQFFWQLGPVRQACGREFPGTLTSSANGDSRRNVDLEVLGNPSGREVMAIDPGHYQGALYLFAGVLVSASRGGPAGEDLGVDPIAASLDFTLSITLEEP